MKFASYNIQYGFGLDGIYDLGRIAESLEGADVIALQEGLDKRPNQGPIVAALEQTLAFQRRAQQRAAMAPQNPVNAGIGGNNGGMWMGPALGPTGGGPAVNIPLG